jgi:beta-lactamase superfamily II metal-dependent hydrolase
MRCSTTFVHASCGLGPYPRSLRSRRSWNRQTVCLGIAIVRRSEGDVFEFGGTHVSVLAPPSDWQTSAQPRNDDSLVLHFS